MSKNTKLGKFLSVVLVAMLMLSIASPAFAEGVEETPVETPVEAPVETVAEAPAQEEVEVPVVTPTPTPTATPDLETPAEDTPEEDAEEAASEEDAAEEAQEEAAEEETPAVEAAPVESAPAETLAAVETASIGEPYTVTIATENSSWVVNGNTSTSFNETLTNLGIEGTVTEVTGSNDELFTVEQDENGNWVLNTKQSFDTDEYIEIKVDGQDEPIRLKVTDPESSVAVDLAKAVVTATWDKNASNEWVWKITGQTSDGTVVDKELNNNGTLTIEQSSNETANTIEIDTTNAETTADKGQWPVLTVILHQVNINSTGAALTVNGGASTASTKGVTTGIVVVLDGANKLTSTNDAGLKINTESGATVNDSTGVTIDELDSNGSLDASSISLNNNAYLSLHSGVINASTISGSNTIGVYFDGATVNATTINGSSNKDKIVFYDGKVTADTIGDSDTLINYYGGAVHTDKLGNSTKSNLTLYPSKDLSLVRTWEFAKNNGTSLTQTELSTLYDRITSSTECKYINTTGTFDYIRSDLVVVNNNGSIGTNNGAVYNNNNYIGTNNGFIGTNAGTVNLNAYDKDSTTIRDIFTGWYFKQGVIAVNTGFVNFNGSTIFDNFGTVAHNRFGNILRNHTAQKQPTFVVLKVNGKIVECKTYTIGSDFRIVLSDVYDEAEMEITNLSILYNSGIRTITIVNGDGTTYTITLDQATVDAGKITVQIKGTEVTAKAGTTTLKVEKDKGKTTTK